VNLSCQRGQKAEPGPGRRAEDEARAVGNRGAMRRRWVVGKEIRRERDVLCLRKRRGPCTRLARCGGRGFLIQGRRLVVYSI
jgi:hypothetical protein